MSIMGAYGFYFLFVLVAALLCLVVASEPEEKTKEETIDDEIP